MNLLIEQRPTITSKIQQQSNSNDVNNNLSSSSSSSLILKIKRQTTKQQTNLNLISSSMANDDNNNTNSRSTIHNQRLKRPITNQTARRSSSPAFNSKQQATKRSVTIDNNNNDLNPNIDDISSKKRFKQDDLNQPSATKVDASVETVSIGLATEPDQLGPCEPGTSVVLEGIVWNETDSGVLVVNVTWRGKTYVGTLLDSTKQDWACPRLTCESPTSDYDARNSSKTSRTKRSNAGGNNRFSNYQSSSLSSSCQQLSSNTLISGCDDRKLRNNIKSRQSKRIQLNTFDDLATNNSPSYRTNTAFFSSINNDIQLISCPESQCHKQFVSNIALQYHLSNAHKKIDSISAISIQQANTRDEEDVAHILANVADYVRRPSPEHQRQTTLTWPCPQISSNLVRSSPLNNNEQTSIHLSTNPTRCVLNNNETNIEQDEIKSTVKSTDHFLLHMQDEPSISSTSSWTNSKIDQTNNNNNNKSVKIPTPPPPPLPSSLDPINLNSTIQTLPTSSSPAYSDISDEDSTTIITNENLQRTPSTINLLTVTNGKFDENEQTLIPNSTWTTQMLLQQYGSYMQQQAFVDKELTSNRMNSKTNPNSTSDSTVKNILDSRRLSTTTKSSPSTIITNDSNTLLNDYQKNLYHYHTNGIINDTKLSTTIVHSLTSPNENLLNLSTTNPLDYSLHNTSSSSIHPSR
ncbi:unnamed protein product [Rotaria sordida]|uniref:C2H2-type domain-containing protein n=1 Tax=Rotaria sordida TaxID=392033 RepID=A0A814ZKY0_9BILA|nr:unnamed protein product [Rotaria sordida]CAF1243734.1 unnamed protein product [Rotaria sordida]CAF3520719.1 unnamed protein product [Rotaria sordida]